MKRMIVTGGAGFVGWHLVKHLLARGEHVLCVDDLRSSIIEENELRMLQSKDDKFRFIKCSDVDVHERLHLHSNDSIEAIFHLASPVGPVGVLREAGSIALSIIQGAMAMADIATVSKCRLVFVSTSEVYGGGIGGVCSETMDCRFQPPTSARKEYALGKLAAECALINSIDHLDVVTARLFNVAGPRQNASKGFVIPRFAQQAINGEPLTVFGDGTDVRAFTHVKDIVDGLWCMYLRGKRGEVYNLGNSANRIAINDLAAQVIELSESRSHVAHVDPTAMFAGYVGAPDKVPDEERAVTELAWRPYRTNRDIIIDALAWETKGNTHGN